MPTYKNLNNQNVRFKEVFPPDKEVAVNFFVPYLDLNFEKVSDEPKVRGRVLLSRNVTNETIDIPYSHAIHISATTASTATLYLADSTEGIYMTSLDTYILKAPWETVGKIKIDGTAQIIVEAIEIPLLKSEVI